MAIETLAELLNQDESGRVTEVKRDIAKLQSQIEQWGRTGAYKKSHVKTLISEEIRKISKKYESQKQAIIQDYKDRIDHAENERLLEIKKNPSFHNAMREEFAFKAEMLTDKELLEKTKYMLRTDKPINERVQGFKSYQELQAVMRQMRARGMNGEVGAMTDLVKSAPGIYFEKTEYAHYQKLAEDLAAVPEGSVAVQRKGEYMAVPIEKALDVETPLKNLA